MPNRTSCEEAFGQNVILIKTITSFLNKFLTKLRGQYFENMENFRKLVSDQLTVEIVDFH